MFQARCAVWVAQFVEPEARGKGYDQKLLLGAFIARIYPMKTKGEAKNADFGEEIHLDLVR